MTQTIKTGSKTKIFLVVRFFSFFLRLVGTFALFLYFVLSIMAWFSSRPVMDDELSSLRGLFILSSSLFLVLVTLMVSLYLHVEESRPSVGEENLDPGTPITNKVYATNESGFVARMAGSIGIALLAIIAGAVNFFPVDAAVPEQVEVASTQGEPTQAAVQIGEDDIRKGLAIALNEWPFLEKHLKVENVKVNGANEVSDSDYAIFFVQKDNMWFLIQCPSELMQVLYLSI